MPASYVCEHMEVMFPGSIAFSYRGNVVTFVPAEAFDNGPEARREYVRLLEDQFDVNNLKVGISSDFSDVFSARWHYTQALIALENGSIFDGDETFYFFESYALKELIINAPGDQPLEMYYSDGLKRLFEHDETSSTSYIETLRTYLNNNMNVTATAAALYIHRSTLLERLSRIKKELWDDLEDPEVRLRLM
ncbi:MAG: helix-turn-helix domain-containing protein, partial [Clostridia bacterium]|nr:helix-turn-helix domain-containing protein [Clostridia bacterium]